MNTDAFLKFSTKCGLDSKIVASFCESFATHVDLPKDKWFKYLPPIKEEVKELVKDKEETIISMSIQLFPLLRALLVEPSNPQTSKNNCFFYSFRRKKAVD